MFRERTQYVDKRVTDAARLQPLKVARIYLQGARGLIKEAQQNPSFSEDSQLVINRLKRFGLNNVASGGAPTPSDIASILVGPTVNYESGAIYPTLPADPDSSAASEGLPTLPIRKHLMRKIVGDGSSSDHRLAVEVLALTIHNSGPDNLAIDPAIKPKAANFKILTSTDDLRSL